MFDEAGASEATHSLTDGRTAIILWGGLFSTTAIVAIWGLWAAQPPTCASLVESLGRPLPANSPGVPRRGLVLVEMLELYRTQHQKYPATLDELSRAFECRLPESDDLWSYRIEVGDDGEQIQFIIYNGWWSYKSRTGWQAEGS